MTPERLMQMVDCDLIAYVLTDPSQTPEALELADRLRSARAALEELGGELMEVRSALNVAMGDGLDQGYVP